MRKGENLLSKKKKSLAKLIQLKESYDLCDIWRIRNPVTSTFTFRQKHSTGFIQVIIVLVFSLL